MTEKETENRHAKEPGSSLKQFSKGKLFGILGLLNRKLNAETMKFERSWLLLLYFNLSWISKFLFAFKAFIANFFPETNKIQLIIGSVNNYMSAEPEYFLGIAAVIAGAWSLSFHYVFNYLNARGDYRLFKFWMKLTQELPAKSDQDYRVAGLSKRENQTFWAKENHVNYVWYRVVNWYTFFMSSTFCIQLFFVK